MATEERWVSVDDVAAHLGVAKDSIYRWVEERNLPAHRVGRLFRFKLSEIDEWVRQHSERGQATNPVQDRAASKSRTDQPKTRSRRKGIR